MTSGPNIPELPFQMLLNDCRGIKTSMRFPAATTPDGNEVPPGWQRDDPSQNTVHDTIIVECGRLSLGPFERGPIHLLLESHSKAEIPPECLEYEPAQPTGDILRGIWFDNAEVATYLAKTWTMPIHVGMFDYEENSQGGVSIFKWTWNEENGPVSELEYARTETIEGGNPTLLRYFWHDGLSILMLDLLMDEKRPVVTPYQTTGFFRSPMMQAEMGVEAYVGVSSLVDPGAAYTGTFHHFGDLQCNEP